MKSKVETLGTQRPHTKHYKNRGERREEREEGE